VRPGLPNFLDAYLFPDQLVPGPSSELLLNGSLEASNISNEMV